jgi:AbrB family looped-hinge helix DNA binding protein
MVSTITSKGQITMPKEIRERLNLHYGDKVEFLLDKSGNVYIIPKKSSLIKLKGIVPRSKKVVSLSEMNNAIEREGSRL